MSEVRALAAMAMTRNSSMFLVSDVRIMTWNVLVRRVSRGPLHGLCVGVGGL